MPWKFLFDDVGQFLTVGIYDPQEAVGIRDYIVYLITLFIFQPLCDLLGAADGLHVHLHHIQVGHPRGLFPRTIFPV